MKDPKANDSRREFLTSNLCLIPEGFLDSLIDRQEQIIQLLSEQKDKVLNGYMTEKQAIEILNKKATWFWLMRRDGKLYFKRIGRTIYYSIESINNLLDLNLQ